ncbi:GntR family transcriptional regulator [Billgrantia endophytica]|uniref:GntR family transcriptional regulator n=1 Tax=Billgrantia endophytica TaxID=2033802 RepID=A0A2N7U0Q8_9GAMM|nr:GntR family transcriptional regulator [Halomonas endophytica]PMR74026.1 GntR family transcriptional regulator [Halomonas endophytica]
MAKQRPLYAQLASRYVKEISDGLYPLGSYLPTESEMAEQHSVSRATARAALNQLVLLGLVSRHKGVGTRVDSVRPSSGYNPSATTVEDLVYYNSATIREVIQVETIVADYELASRLDDKPGRRWAHVTTLRYESGQQQTPICLTEIYIDSAYATVAEKVHGYSGLVVNKICEDYGVTIDEIRQSIRAVGISRDTAKALNCLSEEYGLEITRHYYDTHNSLLLMAISIHPSSRYTYTSSIKRPKNLSSSTTSLSSPEAYVKAEK